MGLKNWLPATIHNYRMKPSKRMENKKEKTPSKNVS